MKLQNIEQVLFPKKKEKKREKKKRKAIKKKLKNWKDNYILEKLDTYRKSK